MTDRARWAVRAPALALTFCGAAFCLLLLTVRESTLACLISLFLIAPAVWAAVIVDLRLPFRTQYERPAVGYLASVRSPGIVLYPIITSTDGDVTSIVAWVQKNRAADDGPDVSHVVLIDLHDSSEPIDREPPVVGRLRSAFASIGSHKVDVLWRAPVWSASEQAWIGRERKRGKIEDFIVSLRSESGPYGDLRGRYGEAQWVFVLDDGSVLRNGTLAEVAGVYGSDDGRAPGLLAPRIVPPPGHTPSRREILLFGRPGPAPDTFPATALMARFGEEFFLGQGAINIDRYLSSLAFRVPSERLLSHDKLEGFYLHAVGMSHGAVEDVPPSTYPVLRAARDRWVRGDTQILPWIVRGRSGTLDRISPLQRWWAATDIAKSLVAPGFVSATVAAGWIERPVSVLVQVLALTLFLVPVVSSLLRVAHVFNGNSTQRREAQRMLLAAVVAICNALDDAIVVVWASGRALVRMASGRHLLEWRASASVRDGNERRDLLGAYSLQRVSVAIAGMLLAAAVFWGDVWLGVLASAWVVSPILNHWLDKDDRP